MGQISWMGKTWDVIAEYGGVYPDENGYLHTVICGGSPAVCWPTGQTWSPQFNLTHYVTGHAVGGQALWTPIWMATWDPAFCEVDIEMQGAKSNYWYNVWKRQTDPYELEWYDNWTYTHPDSLTLNAIHLYGSAPNYSVDFATYYWETTWVLEHTNSYTGPGVPHPEDNIHMWIGLRYAAGSSGRAEITYRQYGTW